MLVSYAQINQKNIKIVKRLVEAKRLKLQEPKLDHIFGSLKVRNILLPNISIISQLKSTHLFDIFVSDIEFETPILDVLYNVAHKHFTERKIMVRGTVIEVDGEPFMTWYVHEYW